MEAKLIFAAGLAGVWLITLGLSWWLGHRTALNQVEQAARDDEAKTKAAEKIDDAAIAAKTAAAVAKIPSETPEQIAKGLLK